MKTQNYQVSVRKETYEKLMKGLPRDGHGRVRYGLAMDRLDSLINAAIDYSEHTVVS
jgi:hypothetical protein